jgi:hypothetical protein
VKSTLDFMSRQKADPTVAADDNPFRQVTAAVRADRCARWTA